MELAGNEKRIQALFRELRFADELMTPEFGGMWSRAQATPLATFRSPRLAFALAIPLALAALCSLVLWSRNREGLQTAVPGVVSTSGQPGSTRVLPAVETTTPQFVIAQSLHNHGRANRTARKLAVRHRSNDRPAVAVTPEIVAISTWESPTAMLLQSPVDDVLTTLPQLDLSARDLKTFLPETFQ
jgi:hypothetical protein